MLSAPRFEGYQARRLHERGLYAPTARPWHLGTKIMTGRDKLVLEVSARVLLQVLAGLKSPGELIDIQSGANLLLGQIERGRTIRAITLKDGGLDEDDDLVVIEFGDDPAAQPLRLRRSEPSERDASAPPKAA